FWQGEREQDWLGEAGAVARRKPNSSEHLLRLKKAFGIEPMNSDTAYAIGEVLYLQSSQGGPGYEARAREAMTWLKRSSELNPYWPNSYFRYGMCLDWIGQHAEAEPYFQRACDRDPQGFLPVAHMGWHYYQIEDYVRAKVWFDKSWHLY